MNVILDFLQVILDAGKIMGIFLQGKSEIFFFNFYFRAIIMYNNLFFIDNLTYKC